MTQKSITYGDKSNAVAIVNAETQISAGDLNEIKEIVNDNAADAQARMEELEGLQIVWAASINAADGAINSESGILAGFITSTEDQTGEYTITHNFGDTDYWVTGTAFDNHVLSNLGKNVNSIIINTMTNAGVLIDSDFDIMIYR